MLFYFISYKKVIFIKKQNKKKEKKLFVRKVIYGGESKIMQEM